MAGAESALSHHPASACAAGGLPAPVPTKNAFLERMRLMEQQRLAANKESDDRHNRMQDQFDVFRNDIEAQLTAIGDHMANMQADLQKSRAESTDQFKQLMTLMQSQAAQQGQNPAWASNGWSNAGWSNDQYQHRNQHLAASTAELPGGEVDEHDASEQAGSPTVPPGAPRDPSNPHY